MSNKINLYRFKELNCGDERIERTGSGAIIPGHLLRFTAGLLAVHNVAGGKVYAKIVANSNELIGGGMDDAYANGDRVFADEYLPGDRAQMLLAIGENAALDAALASAGDGTLRVAKTAVAASKSTGVVGSNTAITFTAAAAGTGGHKIALALIDPAGNDQALAVTVEGTLIKVSLATGVAGAITSTAAEVIAAINAHKGAAALGTAANTGASTGAGVVAAVAAAYLTGGVDADEVVCWADEAVNNAAGSAAARIAVRF